MIEEYPNPAILKSLDMDVEIPEPQEFQNNDDTGDKIIEERDGIHYINKELLETGGFTIKGLNDEFKNLVDSVVE
ncbi:MAG: hypothetical protein LBF78_04985 [Treponema sp.]|nr:hypothetical protein [Treponema sp.]